MSRPRRDDVDLWCEVWAEQWACAFIRAPERARNYIGPLCCCLGRVQMFHDGAGASTEHDRTWPEVFLGDGLVVSVALQHMPESHRDIIRHHYIVRRFDPDTGKCYRWPINVRQMATRMGLRVDIYSLRLQAAKGEIRSSFMLAENRLDY